jgi:SAM-dependent methyltransferase
MAGPLEKWQSRYATGDAGAKREPDPLIVLAANTLPAGHAIDLACGAGRHSLHLASRGWRVSAIDGAPAALALFDAAGIEKQCLDLETSRPSLAADLVVCTFYLDRGLWPHMKANAQAVAFVLPTQDDDPAVTPMNPAYLARAGELDQAFQGWRIVRSAQRKSPGSRRVIEFLATAPPLSPVL